MALLFLALILFATGATGRQCVQDPQPGNGNILRFTYNFCSDQSGDALGFGVLDNTTGSRHWYKDRLCMAVPNIAAEQAREYTIRVQLNNDIGHVSSNAPPVVDAGHPGLVFNIRDSASYDFVLFRSHQTNTCYGYGYVVNGVLYYNIHKTGPCPRGAPKGRRWHDVMLRVIGRQTYLYLNNDHVTTFPHHFHNVARSGPAILKGYGNRVLFRNFTIRSDCNQ